jgi:LacI family transcriptional regulator
VTLKDIAELANTSVSTVSRSLNDSDLVSEETKQRIKLIAREHGFQFNASARGLVTNTTGTVGVILPENFDRFDVLLYHAALHNDFRRSLERADKDMIVAFLKNRFTGMKNVEKLVTRKKVDGLIIVQSVIDRETVRYLKRSNVPFVMTQYPPAVADPGYDVVYSDNWAGGKLVAEHFLERGFSAVACISGGEEIQSQQRIAGFTDTLLAKGVHLDPDLVLAGDFQSGTATRLVQEHIDRLRDVDAIFAVNDLMAFGAMQSLQKEGLRVPDDVAVAGYDDTPLASITIPGLTSVHQSREEIAFLACELLLDLMGQGAGSSAGQTVPRTIAIQPQLVVRESSRRR